MEPRPTVSRGIDLTPDLLATQGRALRGLACSLLGDVHAAEDVVQETWLACLKHPGALPQRVSGWLGTVTKHLALHRLRGEGRRATRERLAAAPERLEALQQRTLEREEALRAVTQALLALEEPYKTALLLRFYEDLSTSEIAAELELPLSTVKSRLSRGVERLRAKLGAEFGGDDLRRTRALRALAGLPLPGAALGTAAPVSTAVSTVGAAAAMSLKLPAAAAVVALAGGALWWANRAQEERTELARAAEPVATQTGANTLAASPQSPQQSPATADAEKTPGQRESVSTTPARAGLDALETLPAETSFSYRISGQVRDEFDLPLQGARVFLGPRGLPLNHVAETDGEGRFALEFDGRRAALDCAFTVDDGGGRMLGLTELHLVSGRELVVDVGLSQASNDGRSVVAMRGAEGAVALASKEEPVKLRYRFEGEDGGPAEPEVVAQAALVLANRIGFAYRSADPLGRAPKAARGANGRLQFVDPPPSGVCARDLTADELAFKGDLAAFEASKVWSIDGSLVEFTLPTVEGDLAATEELFEEATPVPSSSIRGVVRDAEGAPRQGVTVVWSAPDRGRVSAVSGENGEYLLEEVRPGKGVVRAGGGDRGRARGDVTLAAEQELTWNPVLDRGDEVAGRVVLLESKNALSGVLIELWSTSSSFLWCDSTVTDDDCRFAIPNVPSGPLELFVYASGVMHPASSFPIRIVRPVFAPVELGEIVLDVNEIVSGSLSLTVLGPDGEPLPGAEVRVWQGSSGRGCFAGEPDDTGKLTLAGLPHGAYRVEAGGPFGWRDLGTVWFDEDVELPPERFAPAGFAELLLAYFDGGSWSSFTVWSAQRDVFARVDSRDLRPASLYLRAGDYVLSAAGKDRRCEAPFVVKPGAVSALELSRANGITARPGALDPAIGSGARCSACHVAAPGGG
jgi:RNA polymerase sigma-70 factor (ECF subfamily)